jgi:pyruvate/2-oxoglutarate dehydrogenase complex dihydrolipoamide acyltransferase (E2) component
MDIRLPEALWSTSLMPEGALERWRGTHGALISAGAAVAEVRIEDALHEIVAPSAGRLHIYAPVNSVVEPGTVIGAIEQA